jgi:hypothetical protein
VIGDWRLVTGVAAARWRSVTGELRLAVGRNGVPEGRLKYAVYLRLEKWEVVEIEGVEGDF